MPSTILFGFNTLLAVAIIGRAAQNRLLARFPAFFLYLSWMVVSGIYMAVVMSRFGLASESG